MTISQLLASPRDEQNAATKSTQAIAVKNDGDSPSGFLNELSEALSKIEEAAKSKYQEKVKEEESDKVSKGKSRSENEAKINNDAQAEKDTAAKRESEIEQDYLRRNLFLAKKKLEDALFLNGEKKAVGKSGKEDKEGESKAGKAESKSSRLSLSLEEIKTEEEDSSKEAKQKQSSDPAVHAANLGNKVPLKEKSKKTKHAGEEQGNKEEVSVKNIEIHVDPKKDSDPETTSSIKGEVDKKKLETKMEAKRTDKDGPGKTGEQKADTSQKNDKKAVFHVEDRRQLRNNQPKENGQNTQGRDNTQAAKEQRVESDFTNNLSGRLSAENRSQVDSFKSRMLGSEQASRLSRNLRESVNTDIVKNARIILKDNTSGEIRLTLRPENLGGVRIRLQLVDNVIGGKIIVENSSVKEVFMQNMDNLQKAFQASGMETAALDVSVAGGDNGESGAEQQGREVPKMHGFTEIENSVPTLSIVEEGTRLNIIV